MVYAASRLEMVHHKIDRHSTSNSEIVVVECIYGGSGGFRKDSMAVIKPDLPQAANVPFFLDTS